MMALWQPDNLFTIIHRHTWCLNHYYAFDNITMKRTHVAGGRDNVQKLLYGKREHFGAEI